MKIEIKYNGSDYVIYVEPSCFTAVKLGIGETTDKTTGKKTDKATETALGYFVNVSSAVKKIIQYDMSNSNEAISLKTYCERIETAYQELIKQTDL